MTNSNEFSDALACILDGMVVTEDMFEHARGYLSELVMRVAQELTEKTGAPYVAVDEAPETLEQMQTAWANMVAGICPYYPVSSKHCENTIFTSPQANHAMRYLHDSYHVIGGFGTTYEDESKVNAALLVSFDRLAEKHPLVFTLLYLDSQGQTEYFRQHGHFPHHQLNFARAILGLAPVTETE